MFPAKFDYHQAASLDEAIALLGEHPEAKLMAGGHSLIPMMKLRLAQPSMVIDIGRIDTLAGIETRDGSLHIGALTHHAVIAASDAVAAGCAMLAEAAADIGDPQVRNRGTIGGNIAHADPASDLPAVLVAAGATVRLVGPNGARQVAAKDFFVDLLMTDLGAEEVVTTIEVPLADSGTASAYLKVEHPASGYAVCGAAATVRLDSDSRVAAANLAFNGIASRPVDASAVGQALVGGTAEADAIASAVDTHLSVDDPLGDVHASGEYRVSLAKSYGKRALALARDRARDQARR